MKASDVRFEESHCKSLGEDESEFKVFFCIFDGDFEAKGPRATEWPSVRTSLIYLSECFCFFLVIQITLRLKN